MLKVNYELLIGRAFISPQLKHADTETTFLYWEIEVVKQRNYPLHNNITDQHNTELKHPTQDGNKM